MGIFKDERIAEASAKATIYEWMTGEARVAAATASMKTEAIRVTQIADQLQFKADEFRDKIRIASEQAYDNAILRQMQAYWAEVARKRAMAEKQAMTEHEALVKAATNPEGAGALTGALGITHFPAGHPLQGQMAILRKDEQGRIYYAPIGGGGPGTGGMAGGMDPFSKKGAAMMAQTVPVNWNGKEVNLVARSEKAAEHLGKAMEQGANYRKNIQKMLEIIDDPNLGPWERKRLYEQAFNAAGGAYKQLYALGAYDLGVQDLVKSSFPSWVDTKLGADRAKALLQQELESSNAIATNAVQTWSMPGTMQTLPPLSGGDGNSWDAKASSLGGQPVQSPVKPEEEVGGSLGSAGAGAGIGALVGGLPGAAAGFMLGYGK
jgi:hypothetical protein